VTTLPRFAVIARTGFDWDRIVHASHRFFMPVLTGLCLFSGGLLIARAPGPYSEIAAVAVFGLGIGALLNSIAYLQWRSGFHGASADPATFPAESLASEEYLPIPDTTPGAEWEDRFVHRFEPRGQTAESTGPLHAVFTPTADGDRLWVRWLPNEVGQLPSELIGPIASSDAAVLDAEDWATGVGGGNPGSEPLSFHPSSGIHRPESQLWDSTPSVEGALSSLNEPGLPVPGALPMLSQTSSDERPEVRAEQTSTEAPPWMRSILAEAANPIPPHLRGTRLTPRAPPATQSSSREGPEAPPALGVRPRAPTGPLTT
jgi:hypothetical protein